MDTSFLEGKREVSAEWHLKQVVKWLNFDDGRKLDQVLVYASVELRCAIERSIFETLLVVKGKLTPDEEKRCQSKDGIFALMREVDPVYRKTFEFTEIYVSITQTPFKVKILDTAYLTRMWQRLSKYCHQQLKPQESFNSPNREFQKKGFKLIREIINYYYDLQDTKGAYMLPSSMQPEVFAVYNDFINGRIDKQQTKIRLNLMLPVLDTRKKYL